MKLLKLIFSFTLFLSAFLGDYIVFRCKYSDSQVFRATSDSLVHGTIGFLSAALFFSYKLNISTQACICYMIFCTVMSSVIDIDHIFVAKSIQLKSLLFLSNDEMNKVVIPCSSEMTQEEPRPGVISYI